MPLRDEHMDEIRAWWSKRKASDRAWKVGIGEIKARNWSLDSKNPNAPATAEHKTLAQLLGEIQEKEKEMAKVLGEIQKKI